MITTNISKTIIGNQIDYQLGSNRVFTTTKVPSPIPTAYLNKLRYSFHDEPKFIDVTDTFLNMSTLSPAPIPDDTDTEKIDGCDVEATQLTADEELPQSEGGMD